MAGLGAVAMAVAVAVADLVVVVVVVAAAAEGQKAYLGRVVVGHQVVLVQWAGSVAVTLVAC